MEKTAGQIEGDLFKAIKSTSLQTYINGSIYRKGLRPLNSVKEDAVVYFVDGIPGQRQKGNVEVNVFVPDKDNGTGTYTQDLTRTTAIEAALANTFTQLPTTEYDWKLGDTIRTYEDKDSHQHFVCLSLDYSRITF